MSRDNLNRSPVSRSETVSVPRRLAFGILGPVSSSARPVESPASNTYQLALNPLERRFAEGVLRADPKLNAKINSTVGAIVGGQLDQRQRVWLRGKALDAANRKDFHPLSTINPSVPTILNKEQKRIIDRWMGTLPDSPDGKASRNAYERALRDGTIVVR